MFVWLAASFLAKLPLMTVGISSSSPPRPVWGIGVRVSHWMVAALVIYTLMGESGPEHRLAGYCALGLVVLRLVVGRYVPSDHSARVALPRWADCTAHLGQILAGRATSRAGHNPLGAVMALVLWSLVVLLGLSGWVSRWEMFWGDDSVELVHTVLSNFLLGCLALHLAGVVVSSLAERQNLVWCMITGRKRVD